MEKSITLKDPIAVDIYEDNKPVRYTKLMLKDYVEPDNQGMILVSENDSDDEDLVPTINLSYRIDSDIVIINVNDNLIEQQILPGLIKRGILTKEPCGEIISGFVNYPAYQLLVTDD